MATASTRKWRLCSCVWQVVDFIWQQAAELCFSPPGSTRMRAFRSCASRHLGDQPLHHHQFIARHRTTKTISIVVTDVVPVIAAL
jgi:hypothetical protein